MTSHHDAESVKARENIHFTFTRRINICDFMTQYAFLETVYASQGWDLSNGH